MQLKSVILLSTITLTLSAPIEATINRRFFNPFGIFRNTFQTGRNLNNIERENDEQSEAEGAIAAIPSDYMDTKIPNTGNRNSIPPPESVPDFEM